MDQAPRLAVINGLRGLAIAAVFYQHLVGPLVPPGTFAIEIAGIPVSAPLHHGNFGVDLFFVLSGLVLVLPYASGRRTLKEAGAVRQFYRRRALRLLPLYYANVIAAMALFRPVRVASSEGWWDILFMGTATFPFVERLFFPPYNWPLWSLGLEIWFSALFPLLVLAIDRWRWPRVLVAVLAMALLVRLFGEAWYTDYPSRYLNPIKDSVVGRLDQFVIGMALGAWWVHRGALAPGTARATVAAGVLGVGLAMLIWDWVNLDVLSRAWVPWLSLISTTGLACVVYGSLSLPAGWLRRALTFGPLQVAGMMCFSIYVWHDLVLRRWFGVSRDLSIESVVAVIAIALLWSAVTYRYIEFGHVRDGRSLFRGAADEPPHAPRATPPPPATPA